MSSNVDLQEKLKHLPLDPGVYLMKNAKNEIVYVGKAKSLRNRVRSYFVAVNTKDLKTKILIKSIKDFDIIITKTETEALLLERTLIRHHHPNYNVRLKDGKEYPYIRINFNEPWPRVEKVRRRVDDGAFYVGPFSNVGYLTTSLKLAGKIFPLIRCTRHEFKTVKRPCNYYHMKMCLGPCKLPVERQEYVVTVRNAVAFLMGNNKELAHELKEKMQAASAAEDYELAALLRDQLQALTEVSRRQATVVKTVDDADAIGVCLQDSLATFHVLMIREGKVIGGESFLAESPIQNESEALQEFMLQYYGRYFCRWPLKIWKGWSRPWGHATSSPPAAARSRCRYRNGGRALTWCKWPQKTPSITSKKRSGNDARARLRLRSSRNFSAWTASRIDSNASIFQTSRPPPWWRPMFVLSTANPPRNFTATTP